MADNQSLVGGFELRNCVASGNSTQIWEACEPGGTVPVAMKLLLPESLKDSVAKSTLRHEFKVGKQMEHPSFVRFHRIEITRDHGFFLMDYFRSPSLKTQISSNLPEAQSKFRKIVEAVCQAFQHMHEKGWQHRDIKPDNILVNKTGEVRVIDFSLAMRISGSLGMMLGGKQKQIKGTRTYIAPEVILRKTPTVQSEIYSLGVTLYEVLTGAPPFAGLDPNDLLKKHLSELPAPPTVANPNLVPEVDAVMMRMLAKKPKERPADMREVMSMFRNIKVFKEDPLELHERKIREAKANESLSVDKRLDSRADADRVSRGLAMPVKPTKSKRLTAPMEEITPLIKKTPPQAQQPVAQMPMPGMMPQMPYGVAPMGMQPMMYPGMMQPPMMPQPMMPQQMVMPQMMPPGMMPPAAHAPYPQPNQPAPQQAAPMPPVQQPVSPQPIVPQPAVQPPVMAAVPRPPASASLQPATEQKAVLLPLERRKAAGKISAEEAEALELMTELPDID